MKTPSCCRVSRLKIFRSDRSHLQSLSSDMDISVSEAGVNKCFYGWLRVTSCEEYHFIAKCLTRHSFYWSAGGDVCTTAQQLIRK